MTRRSKIAVGLGIVLAVSVAIWVGVNAYPYAEPKRLWTEADLPQLPESNGWSVLLSMGERDDSLPEEVTVLLPVMSADSSELWHHDEERREAVSSEAVANRLAALHELLDVPAFADACPLEITRSCPHLVMYRLHRLGELELVVLVAEDDWPNALALADSLLRLDHARFDSARGWLSIMIALSNLHTLYRLLEAIRIRYEQHIDKPDDHQAAWNLVLQYCRAPSDPVAALRRTVIAEYLIGVTALGLVTQLEGADSGSELPGWLYNRALTHRMLNDHYTRLMDWVMHPQRRSDDADYEQPTAAGFGWWFRNPVGKLVIDLITPVFRMRVSDFTETHAELDAVRRRLAARLVEN